MQVNNQISSLYDYFTAIGCNGKKADKLVTVDLNLIPKRHKLIRCVMIVLQKLFFFGNFKKNIHLPTVITKLENFANNTPGLSSEMQNQTAFVLAVLKNIRNNQDTHLTTLAKINQLRASQVPTNAVIKDPTPQCMTPKETLTRYQTTIFQSQSPGAKLPLEILEKIFLLTSPDTFKSCALVCKNWSTPAMDPQMWNKILGQANYRLLMASFPAATPPLQAFCAYKNKNVIKQYIKMREELSNKIINDIEHKINTISTGRYTLSKNRNKIIACDQTDSAELDLTKKGSCVGIAGQIALLHPNNKEIVALDIQDQSTLATFSNNDSNYNVKRAYLSKGCLVVVTHTFMYIHDILTKELLQKEAIEKHTLALCDENGPQLVLDVSAREKEKIDNILHECAIREEREHLENRRKQEDKYKTELKDLREIERGLRTLVFSHSRRENCDCRGCNQNKLINIVMRKIHALEELGAKQGWAR
jgi:hypothetical protein